MRIGLDIRDLVSRAPLTPWSEGDNIPWDDPAFSRRMLREHLSQDHDLASRRIERIDAHVEWIHSHLLEGTSSRILDLGCGPGLYAHRLARRGHTCTGIDFGPSSIDHARAVAAEHGLDCRFELADLRRCSFERGQDLVLLNYGQLNVFRRSEARDLIARTFDALRAGGRLLLEVQTFEQVRSADGAAPTWFTAESGLFADGPHLVLHERTWDGGHCSSVERWHVVVPSGAVTRFSLTNEAYTHEEIAGLLADSGFIDPVFLGGYGDAPVEPAMFLVVARRP